MTRRERDTPARFTAAFVPTGNALAAYGTDGEIKLTFVVPSTEAMQAMAAYLALKDKSFVVTLTPE